jgi:hypothetical protein
MLGNMEHRLDCVYHAENANSIRQYSTSGTEPSDVDNRHVADEGVTHIEDESEPVCEETQKAIEQNADLIDYDADEDESIYLEPEYSQDKNIKDGPNFQEIMKANERAQKMRERAEKERVDAEHFAMFEADEAVKARAKWNLRRSRKFELDEESDGCDWTGSEADDPDGPRDIYEAMDMFLEPEEENEALMNHAKAMEEARARAQAELPALDDEYMEE